MAANKVRGSSFSRNVAVATQPQIPGLKCGPNGNVFVSSGIPDLDKILGGGFPLGSLVMVMEDADAPHHMLLLRNFMSQGLVHNQPLLYASPSKDPRGFLGTLPSPASSKDDKSRGHDPDQEKNLRIAWQYKKYFGENNPHFNGQRDDKHDYCNEFDLRKPLERHFLVGQNVDCVSLQDSKDLSTLLERCGTFLSQFPRNDSSITRAGRIAIQSFCAPECEYSNVEWHMLSFIRSLKSMLRSSNAVAVITFPPSRLSPSSSKRWQHMADTLLSVKAIPDEDKELAQLLTGYQDMVGFLNVHRAARINTQKATHHHLLDSEFKGKRGEANVLEQQFGLTPNIREQHQPRRRRIPFPLKSFPDLVERGKVSKMVGPVRPQFVLFGSSIVQLSFNNGGWGAILADIYARKADILLRGYYGWNSRRAVEVLDKVFPKDSATQPSLVVVYFGGNDSMGPHSSGLGPHVPLDEYIENMRKIAIHLKSLSDSTRVIFLSTPPVDEARVNQNTSGVFAHLVRTNDLCGRYSEACIKLCQELDVKVVDLFTALQSRDDWTTACFTDGVHLSSEGSKIVVREILKAIKEAKWQPSLHWKSIPTEFAEDSPYDLVAADGKTTLNPSEWTFHWEIQWD